MIENFINDHDHETPDCPVCRERVGLHTDAIMMLRGQFFYNKDEGYAMFILDPDTKLGFVEIPDALGPGQPQYALIVDPNPTGPIAAAHAACVEDELSMIDEDDEDDIEVDIDMEMDAEMELAMQRDGDDKLWDEHDLLVPGRR
jgi:hypothetical protein